MRNEIAVGVTAACLVLAACGGNDHADDSTARESNAAEAGASASSATGPVEAGETPTTATVTDGDTTSVSIGPGGGNLTTDDTRVSVNSREGVSATVTTNSR